MRAEISQRGIAQASRTFQMDDTTKKTLLSAAASFAATAIVVRTVAADLVPYDLQEYLSSSLSSLLARLSSDLTVSVDEHDGLVANQMYRHAEAYLSDRLPPSARRLRVRSDSDTDALRVAMHPDEEVVDRFRRVKFTWKLLSRAGAEPRSSSRRRHPTYTNRTYETAAAPASGSKTLELRFHRKHREMAMKQYLPHVIERAKSIGEERRAVKLHTNEDEYSWTTVGLRHPATFGTLAMEEGAKREVVEDLERFVGRKEYYRRVGKAWKRGYLLYGPPGTGKSSLVAAMANYLRFDVYDLELSNVGSNSQLRSLLLKTANRSILVVEDIDCSVRFGPRDDSERGEDTEKVTLSGLLNCVDGLWSSCGDEKIIVFTTNHKDRLDPALLRPGRMDVHVHMSYCTPCGFRVLASNYLAIDNHPLFPAIEESIREVDVTPAEVAEELMKSDDADAALEGLIKFLRRTKSSTKL